MSRQFGGHSMYAPLRRVVVRRPDESLARADPVVWDYQGRPDLEKAKRQHDGLVALLRKANVAVEFHDAPLPDHADAIFVHDPAIVTDQGAVVLRMAKSLRRGEEQALGQFLESLDIPIVAHLWPPATAEGGDLLWLDNNVLAVGIGFRTNQQGADQLAAILKNQGVHVLPVQLPYYRGASSCLHLMSIISVIDHRLAVVYPELLPVPLWQFLNSQGFELIEVPREEFEQSQASNVLALGPRSCVLIEGNEVTGQRLREAGCEVATYHGDELSLKTEGGPTCLTRPILRGA